MKKYNRLCLKTQKFWPAEGDLLPSKLCEFLSEDDLLGSADGGRWHSSSSFGSVDGFDNCCSMCSEFAKPPRRPLPRPPMYRPLPVNSEGEFVEASSSDFSTNPLILWLETGGSDFSVESSLGGCAKWALACLVVWGLLKWLWVLFEDEGFSTDRG